MNNITARQIANVLEAKGLPTFEVTEANEIEDGCVMLTARVHVQVGGGTANVVCEVEDGCFQFYRQHTTFSGLLRDIRAALNGSGGEKLYVGK